MFFFQHHRKFKQNFLDKQKHRKVYHSLTIRVSHFTRPVKDENLQVSNMVVVHRYLGVLVLFCSTLFATVLSNIWGHKLVVRASHLASKSSSFTRALLFFEHFVITDICGHLDLDYILHLKTVLSLCLSRSFAIHNTKKVLQM